MFVATIHERQLHSISIVCAENCCVPLNWNFSLPDGEYHHCSTSFTFVTESSCMISHTRRTSLCRWQCCGFLLRFSTLRRYMLDILSALSLSLSLSLCADALLCGAIVVVLYCFLWLCIVVNVCCCISFARSLFAKDWRLILCSGVGILLPGGVTCSELSLTFYCNLCAGKSSINNNPICY